MFTIVSTARQTVILDNIGMIDVCYNLFMILMGVDSTYWATRAVTITGDQEGDTHKTSNCQHS